MSTDLEQGIGTVTVGVEVYQGFTAGKPTYAASVDISAQVLRQDKVVRSKDGDDLLATLTLWVDSGEATIPTRNDRLTYAADTYIVVQKNEVRDFDGVLDHVLLRARDE